MYYGARYYDAYLNRWTSPDSIVPQAGNPQALNRYSYVGNNPLTYNDPSGHCWGFAGGVRSLPSYDVTCGNLDMALTIVQHPNANWQEKAFAGWYIATEGVAHVSLALGSGILAWEAIVPACADGDCSNEGKAAVETAKTGVNALKQNYDRGLELAEKGQLGKYLDFFKDGMSDASAPSEVPTTGIQDILGKSSNIYVVGKPIVGKDLDLIVVGEQVTQLTENQIQTLNQIAVQAGYTDAHVQFMNYMQAAAFRFATQHDPLQVIENLRNPMLWRLLGME